MSAQWQTTSWPSGYKRQYPSQKKAYEHVIQLRQDYEQGWESDSLVVVRVSEDKGPWRTYERLTFTRHLVTTKPKEQAK